MQDNLEKNAIIGDLCRQVWTDFFVERSASADDELGGFDADTQRALIAVAIHESEEAGHAVSRKSFAQAVSARLHASGLPNPAITSRELDRITTLLRDISKEDEDPSGVSVFFPPFDDAPAYSPQGELLPPPPSGQLDEQSTTAGSPTP
ncbi:unnamed protein product, partial [Amoebophrya sp. A25]|eukprot:GSA25T00004069001.1